MRLTPLITSTVTATSPTAAASPGRWTGQVATTAAPTATWPSRRTRGGRSKRSSATPSAVAPPRGTSTSGRPTAAPTAVPASTATPPR